MSSAVNGVKEAVKDLLSTGPETPTTEQAEPGPQDHSKVQHYIGEYITQL